MINTYFHPFNLFYPPQVDSSSQRTFALLKSNLSGEIHVCLPLRLVSGGEEHNLEWCALAVIYGDFFGVFLIPGGTYL